MEIHCPHCLNAIELAEEEPLEEIVCPSCGSNFQLQLGTTVVFMDDAEWQRQAAATPVKLQFRGALEAGCAVGKFEVIDTVGIGAFGTVYKAHDPELQREVAIKIPRLGSQATKDELERLVHEARNVARLKHPGIVPVYEVGQIDGVPFLVSEFVGGPTLAQRLTTRRFTPQEAAELVATVADALQYAHEQGVIHRDVKPANIMLGDDGRPRITDFGVAKREAGEMSMTMDGQVVGTPAYMSPEQAAGEARNVDGRSDVYSLGVILYQLVAAELPFRGSPRMLIHQVLNEEPRHPRSLNDHVPRDLESICLKAMAKEPRRRYGSAGELADDLRRFLRAEPVRARAIGVVTRAWLWCHRPERVHEAGAFMVFPGVVLTAWGLLGLAGLVTRAPSASGQFRELALSEVSAICVFYLPMIWLGLATMKKSLLALWTGAIVSTFNLLLTQVFGSQDIFGYASQSGVGPTSPATRPSMLGLVSVLATIQFAAYVIALVAYYSNRNVMRWSQVEAKAETETTPPP